MNYWFDLLRIGSHSFGRFIGSPLDGVTNLPFRKTVRLFSPTTLLYSEICHCDTIVNSEPQAWGIENNEQHINFQMSAADQRYIEQACERVSALGLSMVDINIGCPAKTVVNKGAGSALMGDVPRLISVIKLFRAHISVPLTVKMRAGFKEPNALYVAQLLEGLGIDAICIHPRLQSQGFTGEPDYTIVGAIKQQVTIPVLVSGGITSFAQAQHVYDITGVDGFLVGRALLGRPWFLQKLTVESQGGSYEAIKALISKVAVQHLEYSAQWFGPSRGLAYFKKHLKEYLVQLEIPRESGIQLLSCPSQQLFKELWHMHVETHIQQACHMKLVNKL